jgi:lipoprotein NlpI
MVNRWLTVMIGLPFLLYQTTTACREARGQGALEPGWSSRVEKALADGQGDEALRLVDQAVAAAPSQSTVYLVRGMVYFRLGQIDRSLQDFDRSIELAPLTKAECWQRGISLYYLGQFQQGREQFEVHRTVNPNDVENAFWHFLCVAKQSGVAAARDALLPCGHDSRAPLMEVLQMIRGQLEPPAVIAAAEAAHGGPTTKALSRFYGHLYVGLYHDALGQTEPAKEHLRQCLDQQVGGYMRDVAIVHRRLLEQKPAADRP